MLRADAAPNTEPAAAPSCASTIEHRIASRTTKRPPPTCLCNDPKTCRGLTAAFSMLNDPRKGFVWVPANNKKVREAYLKCLPLAGKATPFDYVAAHHFDPKIVLNQDKVIRKRQDKTKAIVPTTMSEDEVSELGIDLENTNALLPVDEKDNREYIVVPTYPLEKAKADVTSLLASGSKSNKECLCGNPDNQCKALTGAFRILNDPRKGFIRIPRFHNKGSNEVRRAYLRHLLPEHPIIQETPTKYVAAHHFDPSIVLAHEEHIGRPDEKTRVVPRILTKEDVMRTGVNVDACENMVDKELGRVYVVAPNHSIEMAKADVTSILNHTYDESLDEDTEEAESLEGNGVETTEMVVAPDSVNEDEVAVKTLSHCEPSPAAEIEETRRNEIANNPPEPTSDVPLPLHDICTCRDAPESLETLPEPDATARNTDNEIDESQDNTTNKKQTCASTGETEADRQVADPLPATSEAPSAHSAQETKLSQTDESSAKERPLTESAAKIPPPLPDKEIKSCNQAADSSTPRTSESSKKPSPAMRLDENDEKFPPLKVNFGKVSIREYPIIPGDNPGGTKGPPLTIAWEHQRELTVKLDSYEATRPTRRTKVEFDVPPNVRHQLLRKSGHSLREIQKYTKKATIVRNRRRSSVGLKHLFVLSETRERLTRGLSNMTFRKGQKRKEREYLLSSLQLDRGYAKAQSQLTEPPSFEEEHE